jgi:NADPH2:quinone reductase
MGEGVTRFKVGDRVAYNGTLGAYAEAAVSRPTAR